ncbi:MAG: hypothetical protein IJK15_05705 [Bacteroidaceae bacterium]|nr:hypothetical protein [Bacteroidaceae bacterium]
MDEQLKTIKQGSPRWLDCDLNCDCCASFHRDFDGPCVLNVCSMAF